MIERPFLLELAEGCNQFSVFCLCAYRDTQTVLTKLHPMTVTHDDTLIYQIVVDLRGVGHPRQEEVRICGVYFLTDGQQSECVYHP